MKNAKPNIIFINVDQFCLHTISGYGYEYIRTPNINKLIKNGVSFMKSYTAEPICTPARTSWWTGLYPSEHGVIYNSTSCHDDIIDLGQYLNDNGYNALFTGKWHVDGRNVEKSFHVMHEGGRFGEITDNDVTKAAKNVIKNYKSEKPLFLNIGYMNPHDCCINNIDDNIDGNLEILEEGIINIDDLPPLPGTYNYDGADNATVELVLRKPHPFLKSNMDDTKWRYYIYKYLRLCEMVDREIGAVLSELEKSPMKDNTIIIFTSDHGDGTAGHKTKGKSTLWDESVSVPLIISTLSDSMGIKKDVKDNKHFASGTDIFPTVCDMAGIPIPETISGLSLYEIVQGKEPAEFRKYAYAESIHYSRMIRSDRYKYIMDYAPNSDDYLNNPNHKTHKIFRELLYDMEDQGEVLNLSNNEAYKDILAEHRQMLFDMESKLNQRDIKDDETGPRMLDRNLQRYREHFNK